MNKQDVQQRGGIINSGLKLQGQPVMSLEVTWHMVLMTVYTVQCPIGVQCVTVRSIALFPQYGELSTHSLLRVTDCGSSVVGQLDDSSRDVECLRTWHSRRASAPCVLTDRRRMWPMMEWRRRLWCWVCSEDSSCRPRLCWWWQTVT